VLWGHRHPFDDGFHAMSFRRAQDGAAWRLSPSHHRERGTVTLLGVVDSEADKTVAGLRAREVEAPSVSRTN